MKKNRARTSPRRTVASERQLAALELRKRGLSYRAIAAELKCEVSHAYKMVSDMLAMIRAKATEAAEDIVALELERLDTLHERHFPKAVGKTHKIAMEATDRVLAIAQRREKLLGLAAPTTQVIKGDVSVQSTGLDLSGLSTQEIESLEGILDKIRPAGRPAEPEGSVEPCTEGTLTT